MTALTDETHFFGDGHEHADPAKKALTKAMTEDELLQAIYDAALYLGWRIHHDRRSDKAIQQGHSGFPDLVLARDRRVLFLELKSENGRLSPDQIEWLNAIDGDWPDGTENAIALLVRPSNLDFILGLLR